MYLFICIYDISNESVLTLLSILTIIRKDILGDRAFKFHKKTVILIRIIIQEKGRLLSFLISQPKQ